MATINRDFIGFETGGGDEVAVEDLMAVRQGQGDAWVEDVVMEMDVVHGSFAARVDGPIINGRQTMRVGLIIQPQSDADMNVIHEALLGGRGPAMLRALAVALDGGPVDVVSITPNTTPTPPVKVTKKKKVRTRTRAMQV